jgi:hypothetical protein
MNFNFSMDNYYLIGAIALAFLLISVGAFMYFRNRGAPAEETGATAAEVYQEVASEEPPQPEPAGDEEHAHAE